MNTKSDVSTFDLMLKLISKNISKSVNLNPIKLTRKQYSYLVITLTFNATCCSFFIHSFIHTVQGNMFECIRIVIPAVKDKASVMLMLVINVRITYQRTKRHGYGLSVEVDKMTV